MEDLTFAYLDGGSVVMLNRPGTASTPPSCDGLRVFRWLFCGIASETMKATDKALQPSTQRPKEMWYQLDYEEEEQGGHHKEHAPLLVGPAKL